MFRILLTMETLHNTRCREYIILRHHISMYAQRFRKRNKDTEIKFLTRDNLLPFNALYHIIKINNKYQIAQTIESKYEALVQIPSSHVYRLQLVKSSPKSKYHVHTKDSIFDLSSWLNTSFLLLKHKV